MAVALQCPRAPVPAEACNSPSFGCRWKRHRHFSAIGRHTNTPPSSVGVPGSGKAGGSVEMMTDFATSGQRLMRDKHEIQRALYFCCTYMGIFHRAADMLVRTRFSRMPSFRGTYKVSTLRQEVRDAVAPLRDRVLGELAWNLVANSSGRASLTTDGWTDEHTSQKCLAMTLHFPDERATRDSQLLHWCCCCC